MTDLYGKDNQGSALVAAELTKLRAEGRDVERLREYIKLATDDRTPMAKMLARDIIVRELPGILEELEMLRKGIAELCCDGCEYGDLCPPFAGTRHGTCTSCQLRDLAGLSREGLS